jgi:hypothetical protein
MNAQRVLGEIWIYSNFFLFFAYNHPLFIGGWKYFSKLVSNVNERSLEVPPISLSDPKVEFGGDFGYGGDPLHPISG